MTNLILIIYLLSTLCILVGAYYVNFKYAFKRGMLWIGIGYCLFFSAVTIMYVL